MRLHDLFAEDHRPLEQFGGAQFKIQRLEPGDEEYADIKVSVLDDWGNEAGFAKFASDGKDLDPRALKVHDRYRGQGFAKLIYDFMKAKGYRIIRSWDQTDDGTHFWNKNRGEDVRVWESFDQPYPVEFEHSEYGDVDALTRLPDGTYLSIMFNQESGHDGHHPSHYSVEFYRNSSQEVTGEGDAYRVFATVIEAIRQFLIKMKPDSISFSASKEPEIDMAKPGANVNPESRAKLYNRLVQRYAGALGYSVKQQEGDGKVNYTLRKVKGIKEGILDKFTKPKLKFDFSEAGEELYCDVTLGDETVANFTFDRIGDDLEAQDMHVVAEYRGQGIAQRVYDMLKAKGFTIHRSLHQTDAGAAFWDKNRGEGSKVWEEESIDEKINPDITNKDWHAEHTIIVPDIGELQLRAYNISHIHPPQFRVDVVRPDGQTVGTFRFLVMDWEKPETGWRAKWFPKKPKKDAYVMGGNISVWSDYQRKGIATKVYQWLRSMGNDIRPSDTQTAAGKSMWNSFRQKDSLAESLSRVVYHYTTLHAANKILQSGNFELSSTPGSVEQQYAPAGRMYFLSTTRTKTGGYHQGSRWSKVMFVLDGNWFNQRYKSGPIDYWGDRAGAYSGRTSEAEDRVFSAEPTIPIDGVSAVHVFVDTNELDSMNDNLAVNRAMARKGLIAAKTRGIPAYFYTDHNAWLRLDTRKTSDVSKLTGQLSPSYYRGMRRRTYMQNWLELMGATAVNQLSKDADKTRYNLNYDYEREQAAQALANDMSNARRPDSGPERDTAVKIIRYMNKHKLNTVRQFVDHIAAKWKAIGTKQ